MQDKIKHILLTKGHCRDNDVYLIYEIWAEELAKYNLNIKNMHLMPVLKMWAKKEISHPSAIMRARRKVQEEHKDTRADTMSNYYQRNKKTILKRSAVYRKKNRDMILTKKRESYRRNKDD